VSLSVIVVPTPRLVWILCALSAVSLPLYVAVCSEIRTKQSTQSEHHVEFLNVKPGGT